jgi:diaminopimelate decarboxylase
LEKIKSVVNDLGVKAVSGTIGVRVNPLCGAGSIAELSVATASSKFGIPLTPANKVLLIKTFAELDYLKCVMSHVGSQGMALEKLVDGANCIFKLANEIDAVCGHDRITMIDIGGGLSANYDTDEILPTFDNMVNKLVMLVPNFFTVNKAKGRKVATEYGKTLVTKCALVAAKVEDTFENLEVPQSTTAIVHAGADLFLRTAYAPDKFSHRLQILDSNYNNKKGLPCSVNIMGPLCFSGDVLGKGVSMPKPVPGDTVLVLDAGANTISLFSRHCSRQAPAVYGVRGGKAVCIKEGETPADVMSFWG